MRLEGQWHISVTAPGFVQWSVGVPAFIRGGRKATDKQEKGGRKAGDRQEKGERRGKKRDRKTEEKAIKRQQKDR